MSVAWFKTKDGGEAIVFATDHNWPRPFLGAYHTGTRWIPCDWMKDGRWHKELGHPRGLDLVMGSMSNAPAVG